MRRAAKYERVNVNKRDILPWTNCKAAMALSQESFIKET